jgi:hypothetical protein
VTLIVEEIGAAGSLGCSVDMSALEAAMGRVCDVIDQGPRNPVIGEAMGTALRYQDSFVQSEFLSASHGDGRWNDLAFSTKYNRARKAAGGFQRTKGTTMASRVPDAPYAFPVLYDTGNLYSSLTQGESGHWFLITEDSVQSGTQIFHARFHQAGGARLPERPIEIPPDDQTLARMQVTIAAGLQEAINNCL